MEQEGNAYNEELEKLIKTLEENYNDLSNEIEKNQMLAYKLEEVKTEYETKLQKLKSNYNSKSVNFDKRIKELEIKVKEIQKERELYKRRYYAIKSSSLWKIMYPVRKLLDGIKSIKRQLNSKNEIKQITDSPKEENKQVVILNNTPKPKCEPKPKPKPNPDSVDITPRIGLLKSYLYDLGFFELALNDLKGLYQNAKTPHDKRIIGWELLLCYGNHGDKTSARDALELISSVKGHGIGPVMMRMAAIIEAECHEKLGNIDQAKEIIQLELNKAPHPDLFIAALRLEASVDYKLDWLNKLMDNYELMHMSLNDSGEGKTKFDRLQVSPSELKNNRSKSENSTEPKISVIMPAYNSASVIHIAIESVLAQTWKNLELIIVDDHSDDKTLSIIKEYEMKDSRIKVMQTERNSGAYVARNTALSVATGEFVTCHDADDWSHPQKIETQVRHLLDNPNVVGNTSQWTRVTNDLEFHRKWASPKYLVRNISSLMFRRKLVLEKLGYWDSVRFSADYEFASRIVWGFGKEAFVDLETGLLALGREAKSSLTSNSKFGFNGFNYGARREYVEAFRHFHNHAKDLKYDFPLEKRLFPVPTPMLPERNSCSRVFDLIIGSDFRVHGTITLKDLEDLKNFKSKVKNAGIFQMNCYGLETSVIMPEVRELLDDNLRMIVFGEKISCNLLILKHSEILKHKQIYIPEIKAEKIIVIIDKPLSKKIDKQEEASFDIQSCNKNLINYFGKHVKWYPIDSIVRQALMENKEHELIGIELQKQDWVDVKGGIVI